MKWYNRSITWGAYAIMCMISLVIGIVGGLKILADWCGGWRELWSSWMDAMPWNKSNVIKPKDNETEF